MPICEVFTGWRIGPFEIGTELGPPLKDPDVSIVLRRNTSPDGDEDLIIARMLVGSEGEPDKVIIDHCDGVTYSPLTTIIGADINQQPLN